MYGNTKNMIFNALIQNNDSIAVNQQIETPQMIKTGTLGLQDSIQEINKVIGLDKVKTTEMIGVMQEEENSMTYTGTEYDPDVEGSGYYDEDGLADFNRNGIPDRDESTSTETSTDSNTDDSATTTESDTEPEYEPDPEPRTNISGGTTEFAFPTWFSDSLKKGGMIAGLGVLGFIGYKVSDATGLIDKIKQSTKPDPKEKKKEE
tara:strand:- start:1519 stop:2133 length:615 start_codon:yes stop_codon:yes gene_type:complete